MVTLLTIGLSLLAIVCAVEIGARLWLRLFARTYPWKPYTRFEIQPDPKILPQLSPRTTLLANRIGLRGRDVSGNTRTFRIVTCGGSAVECFSLDESEAWPSLVEKKLSEALAMARLGVDEVHVLNLAKSGFTNEALGYLIPRVLDRAGPIDVLTITTGTSAVNAWTKAGTPPLPANVGNAWDDVHWHSESVWGWTPATSATVELVRRAHHLWKRPVARLNSTGGALAAGRLARQNAKEVRDSIPNTNAWIAAYEASLSDLVQVASRYARRVVLLRQSWFDAPNPSPEEMAMFWHGFVGDAPPGKRTIFYSYETFCKLMAHTDAANLRVAKRLGLDTVRLADAVAPTAENYYDQIHYTPAGARRIADLVAASLLALATAGTKSAATGSEDRDQRPAA